MMEQTQDDVTYQIKQAENNALDMLGRQMSKLDETAADLRGMVLSLSDKEMFEPHIWQQGCEEIAAEAEKLMREWRSIQMFKSNGSRTLEGFKAHLAAREAISNYKKKLETFPPEMMIFHREYKAFKGRFFADRVVFLDIEDVLLTGSDWLVPHNIELVGMPEKDQMDKVQFHQRSIALIVRLCDKADASLVLTSKWRREWPHDREALLDRLVEQGLRRELWHENWMLPVVSGLNKWQELARWTESASNLVGLIISGNVPVDPDPLHAKKAEILQTYARDGFGLDNLVDALKFFEVGEASAKVPPSLPPRGGQFYPTTGSRGPSRRSVTSIRP
ncbi:HAD domain-containing protein [Agrobacterium rosae]|uniref:HAD domain-containing protein n=1 Tax=Agrobacterium rosae TaxID=1972867 RepID=A0AAW9FN89_9HYPH|nr:HAD domain-containing protein [Agrobacterium rosae]MDX8305873.1 HAD domain-containing protein [Agrobacterium rosae]